MRCQVRAGRPSDQVVCLCWATIDIRLTIVYRRGLLDACCLDIWLSGMWGRVLLDLRYEPTRGMLRPRLLRFVRWGL